ncbi:hypothetical protein GCM10023144_46650 [Pigmentiphaga soli]|uniref:Muconolactone isomerase domain-containing protein n=1 Tax=Pigmentiphaga soli TaxID=1007095 RepID=A0ABP8HSB4_9BURK
MLFMVISTPRPEQPSAMRAGQRAYWDWMNPLLESGVARHVWLKAGRGAVAVFEVDSNEALHKLVNQWSENVPAHFEIIPLVSKAHQEAIANAGTNPMDL